VALGPRTLIYGVEAANRTAFFPLSGVASLIALDSDGRAVEMASVGREGMVGLAGALGTSFMLGESIQQIAGESFTIPVSVLRTEVERRAGLSDVLERYTTALLAQIGQGVACNRLHDLELRAARWLLMTQDRVGANDFELTQEFFGVMLGVARPQVSLAAGTLQRAGVIRSSRGRIEIVDRRGLESMACSCYDIIRNEFTRLLGGWVDLPETALVGATAGDGAFAH